MSEIVKCKKRKGQPPRRGNPPCSTCNGTGKVEIIVDGSTGIKTIKAVQS